MTGGKDLAMTVSLLLAVIDTPSSVWLHTLPDFEILVNLKWTNLTSIFLKPKSLLEQLH